MSDSSGPEQRTSRRLVAFNTATSSANKMHDDATARRLGFRGGLVPGVDVFAYLTQGVTAEWGTAWLGTGAISARFGSPVYDGDEVEVSATPASPGVLDVAVRSSDGSVCATAIAWRNRDASGEIPRGEGFDAWDPADVPRAELATKPLASPETLAAGTPLATLRAALTVEDAPTYAAAVRDDLPDYGRDGVTHPGWMLRYANYVLSGAVVLPPWIHVASTVRYECPVALGAVVETRGVVLDEFERKGHRFVRCAVVQSVDGDVVATVDHTAIWRPRGEAE